MVQVAPSARQSTSPIGVLIEVVNVAVLLYAPPSGPPNSIDPSDAHDATYVEMSVASTKGRVHTSANAL